MKMIVKSERLVSDSKLVPLGKARVLTKASVFGTQSEGNALRYDIG